MIIQKSGFYIRELDQKLKQIIGPEPLEIFYKSNLFFSLENLPESESDFSPLLKVLWNIVSRGEPTMASLHLSETILREYLKEDYKGINSEKAEISLNLNEDYFRDLDKDLLSVLLLNYKELNFGKVASDFGSKYLKIFQILYDLILAAQLERTIVLSLVRSPGLNVFNFLGVSDYLSKAVIDDLNSIIRSLNNLASKEEKPITELEAEGIICVGISLNEYQPNFITLKNSLPVPETYFSKILTDRHIHYNTLGCIREEEIDGKYRQIFEFKTKKQENALIYFLQNLFRKTQFLPGQIAIINRALVCQDVIGLLPTGGGKSLTYQLCGVLQPGVTIVVDPINSLMKDQFDKLLEYGITMITFINSFNTKDEREHYLNELAEGKYLFLFVSPERFQIEKFRYSLGACNNNFVYYSYAVIDEAHCVSEWGHDFRHTYLNLAQNLKRFCKPKDGALVLFGLTATASFDVLADVQRELEINENAIISLPPQSIDREELNFEIIKIKNSIPEGLKYWVRERAIGTFKYPLMKSFLFNIPTKLKTIESRKDPFFNDPDFYSKVNNEYRNSGVIFCPTKSNKLHNGVLVVHDNLKNENYLDVTTFFSGGDDDTVKDERIESEAKRSVENQSAFLRNEKNLMIATKAFGMGIDKPNIRFSLHYSLPVSLESFYQEAGRAGRDKHSSICSILYHPNDIETNLEFYSNSFKGIDREKEIINELLEEVKYEDLFNLNVLKRQVQDKYPEVYSMRLYNDRYIYLNGPWHQDAANRINIGNIDLQRDLKTYDNSIQNIDHERASEILNFTKDLLRAQSIGNDFLSWLKIKSTAGIKTLLESNSNDSYTLRVGFNNDTITNMSNLIRSEGYEDFDELIIRAAYNFCNDEDEFLDNLSYQYGKASSNPGSLYLSTGAIDHLKSNFNRIRNSSDTQRAIYRLSVAGIIEDYVIDYVGKYIEVLFKPKKENEYVENLRIYLKRYLGIQSTENWLRKIDEVQEQSILKKVLYTLIDFIESVIADKRRRAINYMKALCEIGYKDGDKTFRENMIYYFTSKYARLEFLPKDTDGGRIENVAIVRKYLDYIQNPPDGLGGEIDNAKHLRGACANLRITMTGNNASIDLLSSYSLFALEAKADDTLDNALERPLVNEAIELYRKGFRRLLQLENWTECKSLIMLLNNRILDINPVIKPLLTPLTQELLINRTTYRLTQLIDKIY